MLNVLVQTTTLAGAGKSRSIGAVTAGGHGKAPAPGLSWAPAALKIPSAPLGSDSGEKTASPVTQQGTGEVLRQQGKNLAVKGLVDH